MEGGAKEGWHRGLAVVPFWVFIWTQGGAGTVMDYLVPRSPHCCWMPP